MKRTILSVSILVVTVPTIFGQERREGNRPEGSPTIERIFKDLDKNEDGKISLKEVKGPLKQDFKKIDLNEDGFISKEELEKAPKPKRRQKRRN